jgi:hypothetical protein
MRSPRRVDMRELTLARCSRLRLSHFNNTQHTTIIMSDAHGLIAVPKPWKHRPLHLPELPTELWIDILRTATFVPQLLDSDHVVDFGPSTLRRRQRLSLVSHFIWSGW